MTLIKRAFSYLFDDTISMFRSLKGNTLSCIIVEPMWTIFFVMVSFYLTLYMKEIGLNGIQIGIVTSAGFVSSAFSALLGGPITDRLGRKRTTLIFDIASWSIAMLIWAFAQNFWFFLAASVVSGLGKVVFVSWTCLIVEDATDEQKVSCFTILNMISLVCGLFTPIAGILVKHSGLVPAMRLLYVLGFISMTAMFIIRNANVCETELGRRMMHEHKSLSLAKHMEIYLEALKFLGSKPQAILVMFVNILVNFSIGINIYYIVYIKERLLVDEALASIVPGIASVMMLISVIFIIPRLRNKDVYKNLMLGLSLSVLGWMVFIVVPAGNMTVLLISSAITALGTSITNPFKDTVWNNVIGEKERAKIFSFGQTLVSLTMIPSGMIAAMMYERNPVLPFAAIMIVFLSSLILVATVRRRCS